MPLHSMLSKCYSTPSVGGFGKYQKEEQCRRYEAEGSDYDAPFAKMSQHTL